MKRRRIITTTVIVIVLVIIVTVRLVSNKRSLDDQLKMVTEFNTVIPVNTDTATYKRFVADFSVNGSFDAIHEISISSETQGKIVSLTGGTGDHVKPGQVLASVDNELLKSQLGLAKFNVEKTEKDQQRYEQLSRGDAATAQQYESARQAFVNARSAFTSAKIQYENSFIKAPFDGVITKRYVELGSYLQPGMPVFDMVEINKVKFVVSLTGDEVAKVQKGQPVKVSADAYPGIVYEGRVNAVVVKADQSKRYEVEVEVPNRTDHFLKPGMFGSGLFFSNSAGQLLTIPRKALAGSIKKPEVFVVKGDSVVRQDIRTEILDDNNVAVSEGLKAGDVVVVSGQINLVNGSKIKINK